MTNDFRIVLGVGRRSNWFVSAPISDDDDNFTSGDETASDESHRNESGSRPLGKNVLSG